MYNSQVIAVLNHLSEIKGIVKLISIVSFRSFFFQYKEVKSNYTNSIIIPNFFGLRNWFFFKILIKIITKNSEYIICRGVFATNIALGLSESLKVIYDGRGAISAEQDEYGVYNKTGVENKIFELERKAVLESDFRVSVSEKLVNYWKEKFDYKDKNHVVIPCSYSIKNNNGLSRSDLNYSKEDIIIVFSGSLSKWHSFDTMKKHFENYMKSNNYIKILFLSKKSEISESLKKLFPGRIKDFWLHPNEINSFLSVADYGYVFRENSITNRVASPVKIAEYLSCGLKILISENLGDYSQEIQKNDLGFLIKVNSPLPKLALLKSNERKRIKLFAKNKLYLKSEDISSKYKSIFQ